jgi:hypothetical protein
MAGVKPRYIQPVLHARYSFGTRLCAVPSHALPRRCAAIHRDLPLAGSGHRVEEGGGQSIGNDTCQPTKNLFALGLRHQTQLSPNTVRIFKRAREA